MNKYLQSDTCNVEGRERFIDYLKALGLLCLFLAHVSAPPLIHELRGFDVPFLVFISGYLAVPSFGRKSSPSAYLIKRILRLALPAWVFLCVFYLCMILVGVIPPIADVFRSFMFQRNSGLAGGVWIIWVYIACAIMVPALLKVYSSKRFYIALLGIMIVYEMLLYFSPLCSYPLLYYSLFTFVPYGCVLALGMRFREMSIWEKWAVAIAATITHIGILLCHYYACGAYLFLDACKYPPSLYYLTYAIPISILLMSLFQKCSFDYTAYRVIEFISRHSLWIYLWQILTGCLIKYVLNIKHWLIALILLITISLLITLVQVKIVSCIKKVINNPFLNYLL